MILYSIIFDKKEAQIRLWQVWYWR